MACRGCAGVADKEARLWVLRVRGAPDGEATGTARARLWPAVGMLTLCTRALGAATIAQACLACVLLVQKQFCGSGWG